MSPSFFRSDTTPAAPLCLALGAAALAGCAPPPAAGSGEPAGVVWSGDLMQDLEARGWEPPYFAGTVRTFPEGFHLAMARKALAEPAETIAVGGATYRTSPPLVEAGREIFRHYHYGTHRTWRLLRAVEWSAGAEDAAGYSRRFGVKRDRDGFFVGIVGVERSGGRIEYGRSCALCHSNVGLDGSIVDGMANQEFDLGGYMDSLRPRIRDADLIFVGDASLDVIRNMGPGRADYTPDGVWAPVRVPHLYALRAYGHGVGANGDMGNLWIQCHRKLNDAYAVESEIMEALIAYLLSIEAPANPRSPGEIERRGEAVFRAQRCHRCHPPPYYSTGQVIDQSEIGTDPDRIERGYPKGYKVPGLLRLDQLRLYLHDGSLTDLDQLFDAGRLSPSFAAPGIPPSRRKAGAGVPGHEYGLRLSPEEREALLAYLRSL